VESVESVERVAVAADVREGGSWTLAQRAKNDVLFVAASAAIAIARRVPERVLRVAGMGLGAIAWAILPHARRIALENVTRAFPELGDDERRRLVRRVYLRLGDELGGAVAMLDGALAPLPFAPGALECLQDASKDGRGVLFASAHLGPWERVAATIVAAGVPFTVVAREAYDPRLTRLYESLRGARGVRIVWRGSPGATAGLLRTLRRGRVLGIPMDLASRVPSATVPFLGLPAATPIGPARLALRTGAAVVVGTVDPTLAITTKRLDTAGLDALALTERINDELSARIRAYPEAWVWMHERFRPDPDGA
jgi:KDO2-lipid IV(A) lauroyltransferase